MIKFWLALTAFTLALAFSASESAESIRVACIGNSITAGGYPEKIAPLLGPSYKVENDGVSGGTLLRKGDKPLPLSWALTMPRRNTGTGTITSRTLRP